MKPDPNAIPGPTAPADRLLDLVGDTLDLPPGERAAFLAAACQDDADLLDEARSLVEHSQGTGGFLGRPAYDLAGDVELGSLEAGSLRPGDMLGECRVLSLLGEGGMGEVYLAEDTKLERRVAVKLLKRRLDDASLARRFRHERKVLAALTHPNIARLYGGGNTPEGHAYLIMEYVEGQRLDRYCDARGLGVNDRLTLFRKVCAAVSYAHQNLIVHRDLKPANISVTPEGEPKLLDFGIAKLLDSEGTLPADPTVTIHGAMTPEYACPEQLRGEPITTVSDVYSLGVILYELLAGQRPYQLKSHRFDELACAICETEPLRPSAVASRAVADNLTGPATHHDPPERLRRQIAGDLDNIVAMAMRKEPARRYASVAQFSEDIRRHCDGLPVQARRDTVGYRTGKFVRRNKSGVAAAALVALALVAGLVATTLEARRADRRFEDVRRLAKSILFELEPQIANLPGSTQARSFLVQRALEYLDSLSHEAGNNRELSRELATAYEKVGDVQGNPNSSNLGDLKGSLASYRKAQELLQSLVKADPHSAQSRHALAENYERLGDILWWSNQTDGALVNYRASLALRRALLAEQPASAEHRQGYASVLLRLGDIAGWNKQTDEALAKYRQALPVLHALALDAPLDASAQVGVSRCLSRIGVAQKDAGDYAAAAATFTQAERIVEPLIRQDPNNQAARLENWFIVYSECDALIAQKSLGPALEIAPRMVGMIDALARQDPKNTQLQHNLADSYSYYGEGLLQAERWQEAIDELQRGLEVDSRLAAQSPENGEYNHSCGIYHLYLGQARLHLGRLAEADAEEQAAQSLLETAAANDQANLVPRRELVKVFTTRGEICAQQGQPAAAKGWFQRALAELDATTKQSTSPDDAETLAVLRGKLAALR